MRYIIIITVFFAFTLMAFGQKKLLMQLDSNWEYTNPYIHKYTLDDYLNSTIGDEEIDPYKLDEELLAASIFFSLNKWRRDKKRDIFIYNNKLDGIAYNYSNYYKKYRFINSSENYSRLKRTLTKVPKFIPIDFSFIEGHVYTPYILDYSRGNYYYDKELNSSDDHLYFGEKNTKDSTFVPDPIKRITYNKVANEVVKVWLRGRSSQLIRSKAYQLISVRVKKIPKKKINRKIPQTKVLFLLGAYRNKFMFE